MAPELLLSLVSAIASSVAIVFTFLIYCDVATVRNMLNVLIANFGVFADGLNVRATTSPPADISVANDAEEKIEIGRVPKGAVIPGTPSKAHKWSLHGVVIPPGRDLESHSTLVGMGDFLSYLGSLEPADIASLSTSDQSPYGVVQIAVNQGIFDWKDLSLEDRLIIAQIVRSELRMAVRLHTERDTLCGFEMVNDFVERNGQEFSVE
mmetsp:Transcript_10290/g.28896  ORF Transcript_10290/g.28896 Transcript_10290/m.28896 type:complete len:208 (-) Transcript_10290:164-787(-)|eukprot:CAMPEP_0181042398 /NCGR_PEP_ID=MMETSP1070-20121207/12129_1 /TAXON_ID=265543 /ORGANISM="Minutocellus polymorphus, Strain NH13" /LENGTH=207 /DNA_ID=CAMNT_0023120609 /DNA_START=173 /DNA_END=796 /DNA_ORIENTATION=-